MSQRLQGLYKHVFFTVVIIFSVLFCASVQANDHEPVAFMEKVTSKVLDELRANYKRMNKDQDALIQMVDKLILPHVDFIEMSRWIAGRNAWSKASKEDQKAFIQEFQVLVVRTYAKALIEFHDGEIDFKALRQGADQKKRVMVSSFVLQPKEGKQPLNVSYRLVRYQDTWKVYDMVVEGVSILKGYQAQFSDQIKQQGLASVTNQINQHNRSR